MGVELVVRVGVLGAGLIGGSICKSLRAAGVDDILVYSPSLSTQDEVRRDGFDVVDNVSEIVANVDYLFVCVPLDKQMSVFQEIVAAIEALPQSGIVVTDVSSVKGNDAREAVEMFSTVGVSFVPGHPMAGTESSGYSAATANLFAGATWVLCPDDVPGESLLGLMQLIHIMGSRISLLDIATHDAAVAAISHVPYVAAAAVANLLPTSNVANVALQLAAGSFRDGTRVAASEPWLSTSMVTFNRVEVQRLLKVLQHDISVLSDALASGNFDEVQKFFERGQMVRQQYDLAKSPPQQKVLSCATDDATQVLVAECVAGGLIRLITVEDHKWNVVIDVINQSSL